jgi:glutathione reductase (NADPH)
MTATSTRRKPIASSTAPAVPNIDELDLATGRVEHDHGRGAVDDYLRSVSNPRVHVCGDALETSPQLSPLATYEGGIVGRNIVERETPPRLRRHGDGSLHSPALAAVGLTEAAARQKGLAVDVHVNNMLGWFSAKTSPKPSHGPRSSLIARPTASSSRILSATTNKN